MIDQLQTLTPDPARATRVIAKCHRKMTRRPRRRIALEPALLACVSIVYLTAVALSALEVWMG